KRESLASWLFGVACRVAAKARAKAARRREACRELRHLAAAPGTPDALDEAERAVLCEEIDRLPETFRAAVILCHLNGHTLEEAACQLGCPRGTVASRLARARARLRRRLTKRGVVLSAGGLTAAWSPGASAALVPIGLARSTVQLAGSASATGGTGAA